MNDISRLGGAQPKGAASQSIQARPEWWRRSWFVNFALGFCFTAAGTILLGLMDHGYGIAFLVGAPALITAVVVAEARMEKLLAGFRSNMFLQAVGAVIGLAIFMPLLITPTCGMWGDKCPPVHQVHHVHK